MEDTTVFSALMIVCHNPAEYEDSHGRADIVGVDHIRYLSERCSRMLEHLRQFPNGRAWGTWSQQNKTEENAGQLEAFICAGCRTALAAKFPILAEATIRREEAIVKNHDLTEADFRRTWRKPMPEEFPVSRGYRQFIARAGRTSNRLAFYWGTCLKHECRGSSPANRVGLWVNRHLRAHYVGWELRGESTRTWLFCISKSPMARRSPLA
jgi:hypothetical protein